MNIPFQSFPGISKLARDYFINYERVAAFFHYDYRSRESFMRRSDELKTFSYNNEILQRALIRQNQSYGADESVFTSIERLCSGQAAAIVTGQQAGLFGGPLYTIYKALTAIKLAERQNPAVPSVPVFWIASDDHDYEEINHIHFINRDHQLHKLALASSGEPERTPIYDRIISDDIAQILYELEHDTFPTEFRAAVLQALQSHYQSGASLAQAFAGWIMHLFQGLGMVIIDGSDPELKELGKPLFQQEITANSPSTQAAQAAGEQLVNAGYHQQIPQQSGFLNLFYVDGERYAIRHAGDEYQLSGTNRAFSRDDMLNQPGERFSPNALLRPVYQDVLLPTLAYIAGPGEIAYYAQMKTIYPAFGLHMPIIYPRKSLTLVEKSIDKILSKYDISIPDIWAGSESIIRKLLAEEIPSAIAEPIEHLNNAIDREFKLLHDNVADFDASLISNIEQSRSKMQQQLDFIEKKLMQALKKRNETVVQQIQKSALQLYPGQHLQERMLNIVPYLIKYGPDFVRRLKASMDITSFDHQIVNL